MFDFKLEFNSQEQASQIQELYLNKMENYVFVSTPEI